MDTVSSCFADRRENPEHPPPPCPRSLVITSRGATRTRAIGRRLGASISKGAVIALVGPLGSGKTCLVQGLGRGLGIRRKINSPSFVLMKRYDGPVSLFHWDWYRLNDLDDLESSGFGDCGPEDGVVVIEWADRFLDRIPRPFLRIDLEIEGERMRRLIFRIVGRSEPLEKALAAMAHFARSE